MTSQLNYRLAISELRRLGNKQRAKTNAWFFKTQKGEYGEYDKFIGVSVPEIRTLAKSFKYLPTKELERLLISVWHEARLLALVILTMQYYTLKGAGREAVVRFYLEHRKYINNWDLVDLTAYKILGHYLYDKDRKILFQLARSANMWDRRIGIVATLYFIKQGDLSDSFKIAEILLTDKEDLIHKAVGWMLREAGKKGPKLLLDFLNKYHTKMPRVMLRYAIEKLTYHQRQLYLKTRFDNMS